jgi:hypothetical protein
MAKKQAAKAKKASKITTSQIAACFRDQAAKHGPSFFKYDEAVLAHDTKVSGQKMLEGKLVLAALHKLLPSLRFKRSELKHALGTIWAESTWRRPASERGDWTETMSRRMMNALRAYHTTAVKRKKPSWFDELETFFKDDPAIAVAAEAATDDDHDSIDDLIAKMGEEEEEEEESSGIDDIEDADIAEEQSGNAPGTSTPETVSPHVAGPALAPVLRRPAADKATPGISQDADTWFYRFDTELKQVIRRKPNSTCPEFATSLEVDTDASDDAPVEALFADGARHVCVDLTLAQYKSYCSPRAGSSIIEEHVWCGEHVETHNNLFVRFRADRGMLVALFEQKKQILQVSLEWFETMLWRQEAKEMMKLEPKVVKPNTEQAKKIGAAFVENIAKMYASGSIMKADLYKTRDEHLKADGLVKNTSKRTAPTAEARTEAVETAEAAVETAEAGTVAEAKGPTMKKPSAASSNAAKRKKRLDEPDAFVLKYKVADIIDGFSD